MTVKTVLLIDPVGMLGVDYSGQAQLALLIMVRKA